MRSRTPLVSAGLSCVAALLAGVLTSAPLCAQCIIASAPRLDGTDAGDDLGCSVAVSGNTMVVGVRFFDLPGRVNCGAAYVYVRASDGFVLWGILTASDAAAGDNFGASVAISGDTVVVGSPLDSHAGGAGAGSAYVFLLSDTSFTQQWWLTAANAAPADHFGQSVSISGNSVVVGAPHDDNVGADAGSAYVFVRSGASWAQQAHLIASDAAAASHFGYSVAISGDTIVAGSPEDTHAAGTGAGSAYVFARSGAVWAQQEWLTASDAAGEDSFGFSVGVSGDTIVVGAPFDNHASGTDAGSAYVFVRAGTNWPQQRWLTASDGLANDAFGYSVSISADTVVVGAPLDDHAGGFEAGSAYRFSRSGTTWTQQQWLTASNATESDLFGHAVGVSGDVMIIGAPETTAGTAYPFDPLPYITSPPGPAWVCPGGPAAFSLSAAGPGTLSNLWQLLTAPEIWTDLTVSPLALPCGGTASASTPDAAGTIITVIPCDGISEYQIRCRVSNNCGGVTSVPHLLIIAPPCDINADGGADITDVVDLADAIAGGVSPPNPGACADFNQDGGADTGDVIDLADAVAGGSCP